MNNFSFGGFGSCCAMWLNMIIIYIILVLLYNITYWYKVFVRRPKPLPSPSPNIQTPNSYLRCPQSPYKFSKECQIKLLKVRKDRNFPRFVCQQIFTYVVQ